MILISFRFCGAAESVVSCFRGERGGFRVIASCLGLVCFGGGLRLAIGLAVVGLDANGFFFFHHRECSYGAPPALLSIEIRSECRIATADGTATFTNISFSERP